MQMNLQKSLIHLLTALSIGKVEERELKSLGAYGAAKILSVTDDKLSALDNQVYSSVIAQAATKENAAVILFAHNNAGKAIAPRLSVKLKAGLATGITAIPSKLIPSLLPKKFSQQRHLLMSLSKLLLGYDAYAECFWNNRMSCSLLLKIMHLQ